jgi:6-phosphofructokinase 1
MKNIIYLQSGGPTSAINSSFLGVIKFFQENKEVGKLYGSHFGLQGLIDDDLVEISKSKDYSALKKLPGAILGSARIKLNNDYNDDIHARILDTIQKHDIDYLLFNGGNDSMDTANKLNIFFREKGIKTRVFGIPKTIDNDLEETDHTPGFGSAVSYINKTIMEISLDIASYKKGRVTIIELMGRDAGWLCASSCLSQEYGLGPDLIYVPEVAFDKDKFLKKVKSIYDEKGRCLVCVSEALKDANREYIFADNTHVDSFGHKQLGSVSKNLCDLISRDLHYSTRHIEFNLMQRCASHISSKKDIDEAINCGYYATKFAFEGKEGGVIMVRNNDNTISYSFADLNKLANEVKLMPRDFLNEEGNNISEKGRAYFEIFKEDDIVLPVIDELMPNK